jgi:N-acetylmuramoyl-L-alanine amidase
MRSRCLVVAMVFVSSAAFAATDPAASAYAEAAKNYYALKKDSSRRKLRHHWQNAAQRFEDVARKHPRHPKAPEALFTAALLLEDLSRISFLEADWKSSTADYEKLLELYGKHRLADDAALSLAKLYLDRPELTDKARKTASRALELIPRGDRASELKALLAHLPATKSVTAKKSDASRAKPAAQEAVAAATPKGSKAEPSRDRPEAKHRAAVATARSDGAGRSTRPVVPRPSSKLDASDEEALKERTPQDALRLAFARAVDALQGEPDAVVSSEPARAKSEQHEEGESEEAPPPSADPPLPVVTSKPYEPPPRIPDSAVDALDAHPEEAPVTASANEGAAPRKIRRIVIDAGHGGHDTGAIGRSGTLEKEVSLSVARKVARMLSSSGLDVVLTRDDDRYIKLEDRARIANAAHGDLFISIHCNSAKNRALRGVETYTLNTASDRYSLRLAARENSTSEQGMGDLQFILADLNTKANTDESTRLAKKVQRSIVGQVGSRFSGLKDLGTKQALFYVLLGVRMPAILVETSFLSHPEEERRLASGKYQDELARAIADGVQDFVGDKARVAKKD